MENKGDDDFIAGSKPGLADYFLAPIIFYVGLTPEADKVLGRDGMAGWWKAMNEIESFTSTAPDLG